MFFVDTKDYSSASECYSGHYLMHVTSLKNRDHVLELMKG